jgi:two-component system cell cycle sensor histidine kinase/response regulator CckA
VSTLPLLDKGGRLTAPDSSDHRLNRRFLESKQPEETPAEEIRLQATLLDNIPDCVALILKKHTREIVASNRLARELGAFPGQTCFKTCGRRDDSCPFCLAPTMWATGQPQELEVEYGGTWYKAIWASLSNDLYVHYLFDITGRKRIEEELRNNQQQLSSIYSTVGDAIFQLAVESGDKYRFASINPAFSSITGLPSEALVGRLVEDVIPEPSRTLVLGKYRQAIEQKTVVRWEETSDYPSGRLTGDVTVVPMFDAQGRCTHLVGSVSDITERKRAEESLRESEEQLKSYIESAGDAIYVIEAETGRIRNCNRRACHDLCYSMEELVGLSTKDIEIRLTPGAVDAIHGDLKPGEVSTIEGVHKRKDGSVFPVEIRLTSLAPTQPGHLLAIVRDITEHKRAEEALRESELRRREVLEYGGVGVAYWDLGGRMLYLNERAVKNLGGDSPEEFLGKTLLESFGEEAGSAYLARIREAAVSSEAIEYEDCVDLPVGRRWLSSVHTRVLDAAGEAVGVNVYAVDITERKEAEAALRESENLLRSTMDAMMEGCQIIGFDWRYLYLNDAAVAQARLSRDDLLGESFLEKWPGVEETELFRAMKRSMDGRLAQRINNPFAYPGGGQGWFDLMIQPVPQGVLILSTEITERIQAEAELRERDEQLRQSQKMEAVGQLAGGIAHDFNNLLTAILGYSELLLVSEELADSPARESAEEIKHAAERAASLTKQILAFSRRQTLRPEMASLNAVIAGMAPLLRRTLGEDIDLVTVLHPDLGQTEVDVNQFEQVLMNLAVNARDAMPLGGRLALETADVVLDEEYCRTHSDTAPGSYVMFSVSDTGLGMDEETLSHVFEPFFTTKALGQGTGLGLSTVYGIVKQSGGSINVYSEHGQGSTFRVYLPRVAGPGPVVPPFVPAASSTQGQETILVVEDEESLRSLATRILGELGYTVLSATTAGQALNLLTAHDGPVDLLLTDVVLPGGMQGNDLAQVLTLSRPDLPVLYMSGYPRNAIVHAGRLDEGVSFLEKPFAPAALAAAVRAVMDQTRG